MASLVFEPHGGAAVVVAGVGGGDVVFCVVILCLSVLSMIIFAAASPGGERRRRRRSSSGPVFVGGRGCGCGGRSSGACVCGTYLSWSSPSTYGVEPAKASCGDRSPPANCTWSYAAAALLWKSVRLANFLPFFFFKKNERIITAPTLLVPSTTITTRHEEQITNCNEMELL